MKNTCGFLPDPTPAGVIGTAYYAYSIRLLGEMAAAIGRDAGLRYVYAGNAPGRVGHLEHTHCHGCGEALIERYGYLIRRYRLTDQGTCPSCATPIPGRWAQSYEGQAAFSPFLPHDRTRLSVI